jgi:excisionase family DNA binding protein
MLPIIANFANRYRVSPMSKAESGILTIEEVASYLKIAKRTVYRLAATKKIPAFKVGGAWRFSRIDIDSWIKQLSTGKAEPVKRTTSHKGGRK